MSLHDNSIMVSSTGEIDPVASLTALTAPLSAALPPTSGATTTAAAMAATTTTTLPLLSSSSLLLPSISSPTSSPSISSLSLSAADAPPPPPTAGHLFLPPAATPSDIAPTLHIIHHLLTNLHLHSRDIATLLSNSPPLSAAALLPVAGAAASHLDGHYPNPTWIANPTSAQYTLADIYHQNPNPTSITTNSATSPLLQAAAAPYPNLQ